MRVPRLLAKGVVLSLSYAAGFCSLARMLLWVRVSKFAKPAAQLLLAASNSIHVSIASVPGRYW